MFHLSFADYLLWIIAQIGVLIVAWQLFTRRVIRDFPWFFAYCLLQLVEFAVQFPMLARGLTGATYRMYFYVYWPFQVVDVCLSLAVIREIYRHVFRNYSALRTLGNILFHWSAAILVLVSSAVGLAAHGREFSRVAAGITIFDQSAAIVEGGLLLLLLAIAIFFHLHWNRQLLGIALGFSIYLLIAFVVTAARVQLGTVGIHIWSQIRAIGYCCCTFVWVWSFVRQPQDSREAFPFTASQLERWNGMLGQVLR